MRAEGATKSVSVVQAFLGGAPLSLFIGGHSCASKQNLTFQTPDPGSGAA
jgi:hypothetical protein